MEDKELKAIKDIWAILTTMHDASVAQRILEYLSHKAKHSTQHDFGRSIPLAFTGNTVDKYPRQAQADQLIAIAPDAREI